MDSTNLNTLFDLWEFTSRRTEEENRQRAKYYSKYRDVYKKGDKFTKETLTEEAAILALHKLELKCMSNARKSTVKDVRKDSGSVGDKEQPIDGLHSQAMMKPINQEVMKLLHNPDDNNCAKSYLHERYKNDPVDRFYNPELESWQYGWQLRDPSLSLVNYEVKRTAHTTAKSTYRNNGLLNDSDLCNPELTKTQFSL